MRKRILIAGKVDHVYLTHRRKRFCATLDDVVKMKFTIDDGNMMQKFPRKNTHKQSKVLVEKTCVSHMNTKL
jgi:hypothetical protein